MSCILFRCLKTFAARKEASAFINIYAKRVQRENDAKGLTMRDGVTNAY